MLYHENVLNRSFQLGLFLLVVSYFSQPTQLYICIQFKNPLTHLVNVYAINALNQQSDNKTSSSIC